MVIARIVSLVIGYVFGLFQTGYFYGRSQGIDIHNEGSGNVGTTNTLRVLGIKAGLITFLGDLFKAIFAVLIVYFIFRGGYPDSVKVLELYAGFGAVLGHNFPFYMHFKGGKGIACTSGMILAVCPQAAPFCLALFIITVAVTRYVSLGSVLVVAFYLIQVIVFGQAGWLFGLSGATLIEFYIVSACFTAMALWRHRENIVRLLHGTENKLGAEKRKRMKQKSKGFGSEGATMEKVGVIGAGSWGTALAVVLSQNGHKVTIWSVLEDEIAMLQKEHEHLDKLPGVKLPENIIFTTDLEKTVRENDMLVLAVPSVFTRSTAKKMAPYVKEGQIIVCVAKGIEEETLMTLTQVVKQEIPQADAAVMCGPSHAEEVGIGLPTTVVAGAETKETAEHIQDVFMRDVFRVYTNPDVLGMELGGALKNVIALAAGMADGLGYGDNTKAALITRGNTEISRLAIAMGAKPETLAGLTGIGDLIVTCESKHSRNRRAGILIGQGATMEEATKEVKMVVEGIYSAKAALALAQKYHVEIPIVEAVNRVLFEHKSAKEAVTELMQREKRSESANLSWD